MVSQVANCGLIGRLQQGAGGERRAPAKPPRVLLLANPAVIKMSPLGGGGGRGGGGRPMALTCNPSYLGG
jgi:hypothetical protein